MKKILFLFITTSLLATNAIQAQSKKELNKQKQQEAYFQVKKLIESGVFTFEANSANNKGGQKIDVTTNPNYIKFNGASLGVDLLKGYQDHDGIQFEKSDVNFDITYNDEKMKITIKFNTKYNSQNIKLVLTVNLKKNATLTVFYIDFVDPIRVRGKINKG